jgi:molybdenum cofactor cytidylyltransferase
MNPSLRSQLGNAHPARTAPLVLAAGAARRMGHRPKCLLEIEGRPLLLRLLDALRQAGMPAPVVVLGAYAQQIAQALQGRGAQTVMQSDLEASQISSLRLGLAATDPHAEAVMVLLADQPLIRTQELTDLIHAYTARPAGVHMVQPHVAGLPGNPAMLSQEARQQILAGPAEMGAQQWRSQNPQAYYAWDSGNLRYRTDLDSPQDLENLQSQWGVSAHWPADLQESD